MATTEEIQALPLVEECDILVLAGNAHWVRPLPEAPSGTELVRLPCTEGERVAWGTPLAFRVTDPKAFRIWCLANNKESVTASRILSQSLFQWAAAF